MAKIFKYGPFFETTIWALLTSFFLIFVFVYNYEGNNTPVPQDRMVALTKAPLRISHIGDPLYVTPGDSVRIMGYDQSLSGQGWEFWVETSNGLRGMAPIEAFDNQAIVYDIEAGEVDLELKSGDTITILGRSEKKDASMRYRVKTRSGQVGDLACDHVAFLSISGYTHYNMHYSTAQIMSLSKFNQMYMGKTLSQADSLHRMAHYVSITKNKTMAQFNYHLFNQEDGAFYKPIATFENGVMTSYELKPVRKTNSWILKWLPGVNTILSIDFFSNSISDALYSFSTPPADNTGMRKALGLFLGAIWGIGFLLWMFFTNHAIPLFLFGTLRFRYPLILMSNKAVRWTLLVTDVLLSYLWMVLMLSYGAYWWFLIPLMLVAMKYVFSTFRVTLTSFPPTRCPRCKYLYSIPINHSRREIVREYDEWRPLTKNGGKVKEYTNKYQTWDDVTTTITDGYGNVKNRYTEKKNVQDHSEKHTIYRFDVYDVLYHVTVYKYYYICEECGYETYNFGEDLDELDRKYKDSYHGE